MKREIIKTGDGSTTIHLPHWNEQYHSKHGAIQEAKHVFIEMGLKKVLEQQNEEVAILEIGFGTGLNAMVTWQEMRNKTIQINYTGVEAYPVLPEELEHLNFAEELREEGAPEIFSHFHAAQWDVPTLITPYFNLTKQQKLFEQINENEHYGLIYFDAFGARVQPDLWTEPIFKIMFDALKPQGILVTYAAKGSVRRAMLAVGFKVERLPGPPGKREMLRATKADL